MIIHVRKQFIGFFSLITDLSFKAAQILLIFIVVYVLVFSIFYYLDKKFFRKYEKNTISLIEQYDRFFYLLADKQYQEEIDKDSIGGDPCIAAIRPILNSPQKSYLQHRQLIKENIQKVEILLQEQIISNQEWEDVDDKYRSLKKDKSFHKFFSRLLTIITFGIYRLFIEDISKY